MMDQSIFVAMCQVNIAIGFVYLGFREFRYRNILKEKAWKAFTRAGCDSMAYDSNKHTDDRKFSDNYHYVMSVASIYLTDKVPKQIAASLSRRQDHRNAFRKLLSWYSNGPDKISVFVTAILLPVIWLWTEPKGDQPTWVIATAQVVVVAQASIVWFVASTVARRIFKRGSYVITVLARESADDQVEAVQPDSLPSGAPAQG